MENYLDRYEPVIGLEVHAQMKTSTKAFCSCSTEFNAPPNTNVCPVCLGHPGTLPVLNKSLVDYIMRLGIATNCSIAANSVFARKNYFYPDLPKGFQISQYDRPICSGGWIEVGGKKIGITRIHMEEDAGKSIHDTQEAETLVDLNRCGIPLIEIVSEPEISSPREAHEYLVKLKLLVQYLDICDANMEEGSLRCDANVSVRKKDDTAFGTKTEVKNLNSFRNVSDALDSEIKRQAGIIERGGNVIHQTLTYDVRTRTTSPVRSKEEAHDYRYFPEPDLVTVLIDDQWKEMIRKSIPELPDARKRRFIKEYSLPEYDSSILTQDKDIADYFEKVCVNLNKKSFKAASNWVMSSIMKVLNEKKFSIRQFNIDPVNISSLIKLIEGGDISNNIAKEVFAEMLKVPGSDDARQDPELIIREKNLMQVSDTSEIERIISKVLKDNPEEVKRYTSGETRLLGYLVGKVMKQSKGKANPRTVNEILETLLNKPGESSN